MQGHQWMANSSCRLPTRWIARPDSRGAEKGHCWWRNHMAAAAMCCCSISKDAYLTSVPYGVDTIVKDGEFLFSSNKQDRQHKTGLDQVGVATRLVSSFITQFEHLLPLWQPGKWLDEHFITFSKLEIERKTLSFFAICLEWRFVWFSWDFVWSLTTCYFSGPSSWRVSYHVRSTVQWPLRWQGNLS